MSFQIDAAQEKIAVNISAKQKDLQIHNDLLQTLIRWLASELKKEDKSPPYACKKLDGITILFDEYPQNSLPYSNAEMQKTLVHNCGPDTQSGLQSK